MAILLIFQFGSGGVFFTPIQVTNVTTIAAALVIIATGVTLLIISGEFDLSVGTTFAIVPVIFALLVVNDGVNVVLALCLAMAAAVVIGLVNGFLTIQLGIPSFIVTLGSFYALQGINIVLTNGGMEVNVPEMPLTQILGGKVFGSALTMEVVWAIVIVGLFWFVLQRTRYGNWVFASGGRRGVARAMGVPDQRIKFSLFVLCSILSGFAGLTVLSRLGIASATYGVDYNLLAIVAVVVGGTSLFGSTGTVLGAAIGAVLVSSIQPGLLNLGAGGTWYQAVIGVVLVVAVLFNIRFEKFRAKRIGIRR